MVTLARNGLIWNPDKMRKKSFPPNLCKFLCFEKMIFLLKCEQKKAVTPSTGF